MSKNRLSDYVMETCDLLFKTINLFRFMERDEKVCCEWTVHQCYIMISLLDKGKLTMKQLSKEMDLTTSTMTRNIDKLVTAGCVNRISDKDDKRRVYVKLSDQGKKTAMFLRDAQREFFSKMLEEVPLSTRKQIVKSLEILIENSKRLSGSCCS